MPLTVKCRLGVDDRDTYEELSNFIRVVAEKGGVTHFIMHARKAFLQGLNPHQNRTVPPLRCAFAGIVMSMYITRISPPHADGVHGACHDGFTALHFWHRLAHL